MTGRAVVTIPRGRAHSHGRIRDSRRGLPVKPARDLDRCVAKDTAPFRDRGNPSQILSNTPLEPEGELGSLTRKARHRQDQTAASCRFASTAVNPASSNLVLSSTDECERAKFGTESDDSLKRLNHDVWAASTSKAIHGSDFNGIDKSLPTDARHHRAVSSARLRHDAHGGVESDGSRVERRAVDEGDGRAGVGRVGEVGVELLEKGNRGAEADCNGGPRVAVLKAIGVAEREELAEI